MRKSGAAVMCILHDRTIGLSVHARTSAGICPAPLASPLDVVPTLGDAAHFNHAKRGGS